MDRITKTIGGLLFGQYPKTSQILQGAMVSGLDRLTGAPVPGPLTLTYGVGKAVFGHYGYKMGEFSMPAWKKTSLYAIGAALPYADKIYSALAPTIEILMR